WMWGPLLRLKPQLPAPAPLPQSPFAGPSVIGYYLHDPRRTGLLASLRGTLEAISVWAWRLTPDGQLAWEIDPQEMSRVASLARSLGMQMYALVHNFQGDAFDANLAHAVLTDPDASRQAVQQIARQAARLQLAGITLDLENVRPADRQALARFVRELAAALHGQGMRLAVAVPARTRDLPADAYDYGALGSTADQLWLMTYDQHYRTGPPGPVASVEWVEQVVRYAVSRVAPSRVVLGLPAYGYAWQEGAPQARGLTYAQAMAELRSSGATLRWHPVHRTPYFVTSQGTQVWFEDRFSAAFKLALVRRYRLGGVAVWRLGQEDPGLWELVRRL
ncbi:MAG TPA: glycosyl hydrolase family 18 protein, partial [Limnochordales bacterium]